jgi:hypothetical protein
MFRGKKAGSGLGNVSASLPFSKQQIPESVRFNTVFNKL